MFDSSNIELFIKNANIMQKKYLRDPANKLKAPSSSSVNTAPKDETEIPFTDLIVADIDANGEF